MYTEKYKTLMKEMEEDTNKWTYFPCSWVRRINIVKMSILPKPICRYNEMPIKIPMEFFTKIYMEPQKMPDKVIIRKTNKAGGITHPDFKIYYKAVVI